jgi:hypothetical protein
VQGINVHRYAYSPSYVTSNGLRSIKGILNYSLSTAWKTIGTKYDLYYFGQWPVLHALLAKPLVSQPDAADVMSLDDFLHQYR